VRPTLLVSRECCQQWGAQCRSQTDLGLRKWVISLFTLVAEQGGLRPIECPGEAGAGGRQM